MILGKLQYAHAMTIVLIRVVELFILPGITIYSQSSQTSDKLGSLIALDFSGPLSATLMSPD